MPLSDYINNQRSSIEKNVKRVDRVRTKTSYFEYFYINEENSRE